MSQLTLWGTEPTKGRREAKADAQLARLTAILGTGIEPTGDQAVCFVCHSPCPAHLLGHDACTGRAKRDRTPEIRDISESERRVA